MNASRLHPLPQNLQPVTNHEAVVREEARRTRATIWKVALVVIACVILSPILFVAAPVVAVVLGVLCLAGGVGALAGKWFARRREQRLLGEIWQRNDKVVPMHPNTASVPVEVADPRNSAR